MKLFKNESGRSMVEMLGVLAVTGVLSVGGIVGYQTVMNQNKANEIWNDVMIRALYIRSIPNYKERDKSEKFDFEFIGKKGKSGYQITGELYGPEKYTINQFRIDVMGVPRAVCQKVIKTRPDDVMVIFPSGEFSVTCSEDKNNMVFGFDIPNPCSQVCNGRYDSWKRACLNNAQCMPTLGFACQQMPSSGSCETGEHFFKCQGYGFGSDKVKWVWWGDACQ